MIDITRLDGRSITLNADLIEVIDSNPDTLIRLTNGNSYLVRESRSEVVERVIAYRRCIFQCNHLGNQQNRFPQDQGQHVG